MHLPFPLYISRIVVSQIRIPEQDAAAYKHRNNEDGCRPHENSAPPRPKRGLQTSPLGPFLFGRIVRHLLLCGGSHASKIFPFRGSVLLFRPVPNGRKYADLGSLLPSFAGLESESRPSSLDEGNVAAFFALDNSPERLLFFRRGPF